MNLAEALNIFPCTIDTEVKGFIVFCYLKVGGKRRATVVYSKGEFAYMETNIRAITAHVAMRVIADNAYENAGYHETRYVLVPEE